MTEAGVEGKNGWWMGGWIVALQRWIMVNEDSVFNQNAWIGMIFRDDQTDLWDSEEESHLRGWKEGKKEFFVNNLGSPTKERRNGRQIDEEESIKSMFYVASVVYDNPF